MYGRIYDVTDFQIDHPGGPDVLEHIAGQDGTEEFENILHTKKARLMAKKWLIGKVKGEPLGKLFANTDGTGGGGGGGGEGGEDGGGSSNTLIFVAIAIAIAAVLYYFLYFE